MLSIEGGARAVEDFRGEADASLTCLGRDLLAAGYDFVTPTPLTHERYLARHAGRWAENVRDVFGWNLPFRAEAVSPQRMAWMRKADVVQAVPGGWRARVRFSRLGPLLLVHGGFPTNDREAVFFGPDTYRFVHFLRAHVQKAARAVDIGSGSGAGGLALGTRVRTLVCADLSVRALRMSAVNAAINRDIARDAPDHDESEPWGCPAHIEFCASDLYRDLRGDFDLIVANPPYIQDDSERLYRHGGDHMGTDLAVRIVREGLQRLRCGGQLLLYTGSPVVRGTNVVEQALTTTVQEAGHDYHLQCTELDPDVFGEELERRCYADAERIAVIGAKVTRR